MSIKRTLETITLDGGTLPFHFINTVRDRKVEEVHNYLTNYEDVITWCRRMELMEESELAQLLAYCKSHSENAEYAYKKAIDLREVMYSLFSSIAENTTPVPEVLQKFNTFLAEALSQVQLSFDASAYITDIGSDQRFLDKPIWLVLKDTYRLLLEEDRNRMKECQKCGWIFLDHTKNNTKLWCNPQICGSTSKATRYYHNRKSKLNS